MVFRNVTEFFLDRIWLFRDIWAPIVESVIFIVVSMIAGSIWGLVGVLMGVCGIAAVDCLYMEALLSVYTRT
jgi:hypothetical protein